MPATEAEQIKASFKVPEGEESYVHAYVTHKNGVPVATPAVEPYHANIYKELSKTPGFQATVIHQPKGKQQ